MHSSLTAVSNDYSAFYTFIKKKATGCLNRCLLLSNTLWKPRVNNNPGDILLIYTDVFCNKHSCIHNLIQYHSNVIGFCYSLQGVCTE